MKNPPLHMEFSSQGARLPILGLLAAASAAFFLAWVVLQMVETLSERSAQKETIRSLAGQSRAPKPPVASNEKPDPKDVAGALIARQTVRSLNTPWADLLEGLENAPTNVAVLVLEPSAAKRSLSITAEAANPEQMLDYLSALQSDARFSNVSLVSHQRQIQAPGTPLRFQLRANWGELP